MIERSSPVIPCDIAIREVVVEVAIQVGLEWIKMCHMVEHRRRTKAGPSLVASPRGEYVEPKANQEVTHGGPDRRGERPKWDKGHANWEDPMTDPRRINGGVKFWDYQRLSLYRGCEVPEMNTFVTRWPNGGTWQASNKEVKVEQIKEDLMVVQRIRWWSLGHKWELLVRLSIATQRQRWASFQQWV